MPPKKAKKKAKKAGSGKKKEGTGGETVTFKEAVMTYQLEVKQTQLDNIKDDINELQSRNEKQKQRNMYLKKEQNRHINEVIGQAQEIEMDAKNVKQIPYEDVEEALQEKLSAIRIEETSVEERRENIKLLDKELEGLSYQLHQLQDYKDRGQTVDKTHIEVLLKEMEDMDTSYTEMANFFDKSLATMKQTITKQNQENISVHKKLASEVVIKNLDKHTEQEFLDNEWLLKEVSIHRNHIAGVEMEVETLEKQNIETMSYLFQQQLDDMKETKKFYLACKEEEEKECSNLMLLTDSSEDFGDEDEEIIEVDGNVEEEEDIPDDLKWVEKYLHEFDVTPTQDDYKLGPVEMKLLCVIGRKAPFLDVSQMCPPDGVPQSKQSDVHHKWVVEREELRNRNTDIAT